MLEVEFLLSLLIARIAGMYQLSGILNFDFI